MKKEKISLIDRDIVWFALYFLILMLIAFFVRDVSQQPDLWATIENFMDPARGMSMSDPKSFAIGALDIYHFGWIQIENGWLIRLWPPGFMLTEGLVLIIFGLHSPFIVVLIILNSLFAASLLLLIRKNMLLLVPKNWACLLPLLPFCFSIPRLFLLEPVGIILGEGFAIIFFLTAMLMLSLAVQRRSWLIAVAAGLMLALSAYFRSQFELLIVALTALAVPMLVWFAYKIHINKKQQKWDKRKHNLWIMLTIVIALVVGHLSMLPWRIATYLDPYAANLSWVQTEKLVYANAGKTDKQLFDAGGHWLVHGGENIACHLEPSYCGKSDKVAFYSAYFQHLVQWNALKLDILGKYWFSSVNDYMEPMTPPTKLENASNFFFLVCVIVTLPLLWLTRRHQDAAIQWWICGGFYSCFLVIFSLVHFETRYFYAVKIFGMFNAMLLSGIAWQMYSEHVSLSASTDNTQRNRSLGGS